MTMQHPHRHPDRDVALDVTLTTLLGIPRHPWDAYGACTDYWLGHRPLQHPHRCIPDAASVDAILEPDLQLAYERMHIPAWSGCLDLLFGADGPVARLQEHDWRVEIVTPIWNPVTQARVPGAIFAVDISHPIVGGGSWITIPVRTYEALAHELTVACIAILKDDPAAARDGRS